MTRINSNIKSVFSLSRLFLLAGIATFTFVNCKSKKEKFDEGIEKINHVVVIYMENHSFDNLYGKFEGADGANGADSSITQIDSNNNPYKHLPVIPGVYTPATFPSDLPNKAFNIDQFIPSYIETPDVLHYFYEEQLQINAKGSKNGGRMNRFALYNSKSAGLTMGYYETKLLPLYPIAKKYTLCDHFFHSAFGGSFLNHQWLIAAACPIDTSKVEKMYSKPNKHGDSVGGQITADYRVINTSYSVNHPQPDASYFDNNPAELIPNQHNPTIGDLINKKKDLTWAWYSGGWDNAMRGTKYADATFQWHHQPFIYYANYSDTAKQGRTHLRDENEFLAVAKKGKLLNVSFVKPLGLDNEHPGYSEVYNGEHHALELINAVLNGPNAGDTLIILTYDENGGFWDHVPPPPGDRWGPGTRVPAILISPFTKKGYVDHKIYETVSILAFIERRWDLGHLNTRDAKADPFTNAFDF